MLGFVIGLCLGTVVTYILMRAKPQRAKGSHRMTPRKKIDGIWTVRDDRGKKTVDPSRPRVRRAVILERTRRG